MSKVHLVIPARLGSTRLPRKPLAEIAGKPMIVWVAERASLVEADDLTIAVDDQEVLDVVRDHGFECLLTSKDHRSGSDRVLEVASKMGWRDDDVLVNVQGDEPLLPAHIVNQLIDFMIPEQGPVIEFATVSEPIRYQNEFENPNCVKLVTDRDGVALYFSRAPIPFPRDEGVFDAASRGEERNLLKTDYPVKRHVGIYGFRIHALREFSALPESGLELLEKLEQLRWLEAGRKIHVIHSEAPLPGGVDTPEDLAAVELLLLENLK